MTEESFGDFGFVKGNCFDYTDFLCLFVGLWVSYSYSDESYSFFYVFLLLKYFKTF